MGAGLALLLASWTAAVPQLSAPVRLDGRLTEAPTQDAGDAVRVQVATGEAGLWVGVRDAPDAQADKLELWLRFKNAGLAARPFLFGVTRLGVVAPEAPEAAPPQALSLVKSAWGEGVELLLPTRALPRFPSRKPLQLEVCATFKGPKEASRTSCRDFDRPPAVELSEAILPALTPPPRRDPPVGLEGRSDGWLGYGEGLLPLTVWADRPLEGPLLNSLVAEKPVDPKRFGLVFSRGARSPRQRPLRVVLDGEDARGREGPCAEQATLRLGLYEVLGKVAYQVLEVPAATCALGRAVSAVIEGTGPDAELRLSYSGGQVVSFLWSGDHYERTEYGYQKPLHDDPGLPEEPGRLRGDARHPDRARLHARR